MGNIKKNNGWKTKILMQTGLQITTFGVDEQGEIYLAATDGKVYKLRAKQE